MSLSPFPDLTRKARGERLGEGFATGKVKGKSGRTLHVSCGPALLPGRFCPSDASIALATSLYLTFLPDQARAQTAVDEAVRQAQRIARDRVAEERQRRLERNRRDNRPPDGVTIASPRADIVSPDQACIQVETISVRGVTLLDRQAIRKVTDGHEGKCLGLSELNALLEQLTFLYVDKGYIASRAFLPEQDLADGALEIVVVEGRLESIVLDGRAGSNKSEIRMAFPAMIGWPVNLRDIEQGLNR